MSRTTRRVLLAALTVVAVVLGALATLVYLGLREGAPPQASSHEPSWAGARATVVGQNSRGIDGAAIFRGAGESGVVGGADQSRIARSADESLIARGAYLATVGNCIGCHTVRGQPEFSGGRPVPTPFGTLFSTNLTSDTRDGIGGWTADEFWRALHLGKSRDGRLLYPAFPYTDYTRTTRGDADAIFAYLQSLPAVAKANQPAQMRFPYDQRWLLALWRGLYFRPGVYQGDAARSDEWNRGAYLVQGLGHCGACHTPRGPLGAPRADRSLAGGLIPVLDWFAPGLGAMTSQPDDPHAWAALLLSGVSAQSVIVGPMAEVVRNSLQHLADEDVKAISAYLQSLPPVPADAAVLAQRGKPISPAAMQRGGQLYGDHCADCHGRNGEGAGIAYPSLAGNRALTHEPAVNAMRILLNGGFAPGTRHNPRPYGMPPFAPTLDDQQAADVITYIRNAWGNQGGAVQSYEVNRYRSAPPD